MLTNKSIRDSDSTRNGIVAPTATARFDGTPITAVLWRGRWCWRGAEVGKAIGYEQGHYLVDKVRSDWAEEFRESKDYDLLRGDDLREFQASSNDSGDSPKPKLGRGGARSVLVLYESGIDTALILSRTEKGRRLRALLVDHVLPQLRATGTASLPGAPAPAGLTTEEVAKLVAKLLAEHMQFAGGERIERMVLGRDAESTILAPVRRMASRLLPPRANNADRARGVSRLHKTLRRAVGWEGRWCFFPRHRVGELFVALHAEELAVERAAAVLSRDRQLSLMVM